VLGALVATLSIAQTPLPQPDFHNIRHHDTPGEVCDHHDHLLRWHPGAGSATDVAVLHWHWFLLRSDGSDPSAEGDGHALHAHSPDAPATLSDRTPLVVPDTSSRPDLKLSAAQGPPGDLLCPDAPGRAAAAGTSRSAARRAPVARGPKRAAALQRWDC